MKQVKFVRVQSHSLGVSKDFVSEHYFLVGLEVKLVQYLMLFFSVTFYSNSE